MHRHVHTFILQGSVIFFILQNADIEIPNTERFCHMLHIGPNQTSESRKRPESNGSETAEVPKKKSKHKKKKAKKT